MSSPFVIERFNSESNVCDIGSFSSFYRCSGFYPLMLLQPYLDSFLTGCHSLNFFLSRVPSWTHKSVYQYSLIQFFVLFICEWDYLIQIWWVNDFRFFSNSYLGQYFHIPIPDHVSFFVTFVVSQQRERCHLQNDD